MISPVINVLSFKVFFFFSFLFTYINNYYAFSLNHHCLACSLSDASCSKISLVICITLYYFTLFPYGNNGFRTYQVEMFNFLFSEYLVSQIFILLIKFRFSL